MVLTLSNKVLGRSAAFRAAAVLLKKQGECLQHRSQGGLLREFLGDDQLVGLLNTVSLTGLYQS